MTVPLMGAELEEVGHEMNDVMHLPRGMQSTEITANLDRQLFQFIAYFSWLMVFGRGLKKMTKTDAKERIM